MELGWHLREVFAKSDFDVEGCRRNVQLQRDTMLCICCSLSIHDDVWVNLADLVDLDVGHGLVVHTSRIDMAVSMTRQHVIVDICHL